MNFDLHEGDSVHELELFNYEPRRHEFGLLGVDV